MERSTVRVGRFSWCRGWVVVWQNMILAAAATVAASAPADVGPADVGTAEPPAWHAESRQALGAWRRARTADEKLNALGSLAVAARHHPLVLAPLKGELEVGELKVRAGVLKVLSDAGFPEAAESARRGVLDPDPALAATAAAVLGRWAPSGVRDDLIAVWMQPQAPDPATVEAVTAALALSVKASDLRGLKDAASAELRLAALTALRRQGARECAEFVASPDAALADAAAVAIYDDRLEVAWPALVDAGFRAGSALTTPGHLRAVAAAWGTGGQELARQLAHWLAARPLPGPGESIDPAARSAFHALLHWDTLPEKDPVLPHRPFRARPRPAGQAWQALTEQATAVAAWADALGETEAAAWTTWRARIAQAPPAAKEFTGFLGDAARPEGERLYHFQERMKAAHDPASLDELAAAALAAPAAPALRAEARARLFRQHGPGAIPWLLQSLATATASEKQAAIRLLDQHKSAESQAYLMRLLDQARFGLVDPSVVPEVVEAVERRARAEGPESRGLRAALDAWRSTQPPSLGDPLRPWRPALQPGDAEAGRSVFLSDFARCATCHRSAAEAGGGRPAAPPLDGVGARLDGPALLEAIVLPADPASRRTGSAPADGGCRPMGTLLTLRELRDLLTYLQSLP